MSADERDGRIDAFLKASRALTGEEIVERPLWNTVASADAVRQFAFGIGDDNPLWLDPDYAAGTRHGDILAPPTFLTAVLYPMLHGAPVEAPLSNLVGEVAYAWPGPIALGTRLRAAARQADVQESRDREGRRLICIVSEVTYRDGEGAVVGTARGSMLRVAQKGTRLLLDREVARHAPEDLERIQSALLASRRRGAAPFGPDELAPGRSLPRFVIGPLTLGDLICWQSAIGPSYRAGVLGLRDCLNAPHTAVRHPVTGWPVKYSQQHEDAHLTSQRGMPAPFDNGVMRFAQVGRQITDWMGDDGTLTKLRVKTEAPVLVGDATWCDARIAQARHDEEKVLLTIAIEGRNQLGETTTRADAEVSIPLDRVVDEASRGRRSG